MKFPKDIRNLEELPNDFKPTPIGKREQVIEAIRSEVPTATLDTFGSLTIDSRDYTISASLGTNDFCTDIMFEVHGSESAAYVIQRILKRLDVRGWDTGGNQFLDLEGDPTTGFKQWSKYRDHVRDKVTGRQKNWLKSLPLAVFLLAGLVTAVIYRKMDLERRRQAKANNNSDSD